MKKLLTTTALMMTLALPAIAQDYQPDPNAKPGGSIVITYKDDVATLDPAIGYDWQNWSMIKSIFDGLMDYFPGTTELRPGLAESYEISDDGMVFTFHLRPGVKFHNGREMTAEDVKYSLDRVTNPETQSPGAGFFGSIAGYDAMSDGSASELEGVKVIDPATVEISLSRPDATFLHVMALNFARRLRNTASISASTRSAPAHSAWANGPSASGWCSKRTPITGAMAFPTLIRSSSRSDRNPSWRCYVFRTARSTCPAMASRPPSSRK